MTTKDQLQSLIWRAAELPAEEPAELLQSLVEIDPQYQDIYRVYDDERAALARSGDDMRHRRFASDEAVDKIFARYHPTGVSNLKRELPTLQRFVRRNFLRQPDALFCYRTGSLGVPAFSYHQASRAVD
jgi:hypothetical protein